MTIKLKPKKASAVAETPATAATPTAPVSGGATIADRFKLDAPDPKAAKASTGKGTLITVLAALLALGVAGVLTFIIYQHWEFLKSA